MEDRMTQVVDLRAKLRARDEVRAELGDLYAGLLVIVLPSVAVVAAIVMSGGRL